MHFNTKSIGIAILGALIFTATVILTITHFNAPDKPVYVSPSPSARFVQPQTTIAIRYHAAVLPADVQPDLFSVVAGHTGHHAGTVTLSDDQRTIIFKPTVPFTPGGTVNVLFAGGALGKAGQVFESYTTTFTISPKPYQDVILSPSARTASAAPPSTAPSPSVAPKKPVPVAHYLTAPGPLPLITVTHYISAPIEDGEYIFLNTSSTSNEQYLLILDSSGQMVYYKQLPPGRAYTNFTEQPNGMLTYFDGATPANTSQNVIHVLDSSYNEVDQYAAGDGFSADSHDFRLLPNGHALLLATDQEPMDMRAYGGKPNATFIDLVVQELDRAKNVVFEWRASEHIPFIDTYEPLTGDKVDPYHGNSVDVTPDGNLLISMRHLSQVVKVDRQTGDVIWRMGGKHSDFTFTNDEGFSYQHDVLMLPNGHLTAFDNGNRHDPPVSRAVEYAVDETDHTATLVWKYLHTPYLYGSYMGDVEQLPGGHVFIGWGGPNPIASEVTRDGTLLQDFEIGTTNDVVYRWYKLPWAGNPDTSPILVTQPRDDGTALYFSWNGATAVTAYRIETGRTPDHFTLLTTQPKRGFETSLTLSAGQTNLCYVRVLAIDRAGKALRYSNTVHLTGAGCSA